MLYDPTAKPEVKADPISLESLIAWLETQNPKARYVFMDCSGGCLLDLYLFEVTGWKTNPITLHEKACGGGGNYETIAATYPQTFGAALTRARTLSHNPTKGD